jgi:hypothetical protein
MIMNGKQYKLLIYSSHTPLLYPGKMKLLIRDSYRVTGNTLPSAEFRNLLLLELQQSMWPARKDVRKKRLCHVSVSQPVVRGPPVVRDDGTGGPEADLN